MNADWQCAAVALIDGAASAPRWADLGGSSLNGTWRLEIGCERYFVKTHAASRLAMLEAEADGLRELARPGAMRVPAAVACDCAGNCAFLVLEWLDFSSGGRDAALGTALAQLHRTTAEAYGWHRDNTIGTTPQDSACTRDWAAFFRDRRIAPQLALAARNGHGGRETDLAMTELFGGFSAAFHAAYRAAWPLEAGYPVRRTLCNLYHVLNHLNLFGGGDGAQAEAMIGQLLAEAR